MGLTLGVDSVIQAPRLLTTHYTILAPNEYTNRQNCVGQYIHWQICNHSNIETPNKRYDHKPLLVVDNPKVTILWDFSIRTDRTIQANRSDIVIKHKQNKTCKLIDMSVPSDSNISAKEFEKLSKYKDLEIEIAKMWKMKTETIPVTVGALGMIKKGTQKYMLMKFQEICLLLKFKK